MKSLISKLVWLLLLTLASLLLAGGVATAKNPGNVVYVIGDSLSDTGNLYNLVEWPPSPPYAQRYSNGPTWPEYLANTWKVPVQSLAYGGALSGSFLIYGIPTSNLNNVQYPGLFPPLPGASEQVEGLLDQFPNGLNPDALYVIWVGGNDVFLGLASPDGLAQTLVQTAQNIVGTVCKLSSFGARHFLVGNIPDMGLAPFAKTLGPGSAALSDAIAQFNTGLSQALATLAPVCGEDITLFDTYNLLHKVTGEPQQYGLANVTEPCLSPGGVCSNPDQYLYWDEAHPTTAVHAIVAESARNTFCGTGKKHPGLRQKPNVKPPSAWRGVCYGSK
ncbi:MAG: SGNH/GDSL hydrolase family protein [Geothermobacteraceae bacterium]